MKSFGMSFFSFFLVEVITLVSIKLSVSVNKKTVTSEKRLPAPSIPGLYGLKNLLKMRTMRRRKKGGMIGIGQSRKKRQR